MNYLNKIEDLKCLVIEAIPCVDFCITLAANRGTKEDIKFMKECQELLQRMRSEIE
jgi:hypothetical protein